MSPPAAAGGGEAAGADDGLEALLGFAEDLARAAGRLLSSRRAQRRELLGAAARKSSRTDLQSEADRASEALITAALEKARPEDGILAEEDTAAEGTSGYTWVVDPLDGTTNYLYGFGSYAVSIGLEHHGAAVLGVVHDPVLGETFSALAGAGARRNGVRMPRRLPTGPRPEALVGTGFAYEASARRRQALLLPVVLPAVRDVRRAGAAALDLCYVADGRLDGYYEAGLKPWDRSAGVLIACECGCRAVDLEGVGGEASTLVVAPDPLFSELAGLLRRAGELARGSETWP